MSAPTNSRPNFREPKVPNNGVMNFLRSIRKDLSDQKLLGLLAIAWLVRIAVLILLPAGAHSYDLDSWILVSKELLQGRNPYQTTDVLNWPPGWLILVALLSQVSVFTGIDVAVLIRLLLIASESVLIVVLYQFLCRDFPRRTNAKILLFGISLNPVSILLISQHSNFDVLMAFWVTVFTIFFSRFLQEKQSVDWFLACLCLGLGALTKTVPIVLFPLCLFGGRSRPLKTLLLGTALVFGPILLGLATLASLAPEDVLRKVILYRSISGYFGISGFLAYFGFDTLNRIYSTVLFPIGMLIWVFSIGRRMYLKDKMGAEEIFQWTLMILTIVITLGPGYGPQYLQWLVPIGVLVYATSGAAIRKAGRRVLIVASITCVVEYALFESHGQFAVRAIPSTALRDLAAAASQPWPQTMIRLPLFLFLLTLLQTLRRRLF